MERRTACGEGETEMTYIAIFLLGAFVGVFLTALTNYSWEHVRDKEDEQ